MPHFVSCFKLEDELGGYDSSFYPELTSLSQASSPELPLEDMFEGTPMEFDKGEDLGGTYNSSSEQHETLYTQAKILRMCLQDYPEPEYHQGQVIGGDYFSPSPSDEQAELISSGENTWYTPVFDADVVWDPPCTPTPGVPYDMTEAQVSSSTASLSSTTTTVTMDPQTLCQPCGRRFHSRGSLMRHRRTKHGPRVWHLCDQCGKTLSTRASLRNHLMRHSGLRPFQCPHCDSGFVKRCHLHEHVRSKHRHLAVNDAEVVVMDSEVGVQIVHKQVNTCGDGGGVVFKRADGGGVIGVVSAMGDVRTSLVAEDSSGRRRIVTRLLRCGKSDIWRIDESLRM